MRKNSVFHPLTIFPAEGIFSDALNQLFLYFIVLLKN